MLPPTSSGHASDHPCCALAPAGIAGPPHGHAHGACTAAPLPSTVGALWAHVKVEWVAGHCRWQEATVCATEAQEAVQGHLKQLVEGQTWSHLFLVGTQGAVDLIHCPGAAGHAPWVAGGVVGSNQ